MSAFLLMPCWQLQGMTSTQKLVLISLADQCNDDGICWPSVKKIAIRTCLSERAIQNSIKWLYEQGAIQIKEREGRSTIYQVTPAGYAPPQDMRGAPNAPTPAPRSETPAPDAPAPARGAPITHNKPKETKGKPKKGGNGILDLELPDWLTFQNWKDWVEHRLSLKSPLTEKAAHLCIKKLQSLMTQGFSPSDIIEQSIRSGWKDFYPIKGGYEKQSAKVSSNFESNMLAAEQAKSLIFGGKHA